MLLFSDYDLNFTVDTRSGISLYTFLDTHFCHVPKFSPGIEIISTLSILLPVSDEPENPHLEGGLKKICQRMIN